jgi:hypothetical protein
MNDDWVRFYQFVQACHEGRLRESDRAFGLRLGALGFASRSIRELRQAYYHGIRQLKSHVILNSVIMLAKSGIALPMVDLATLGRASHDARRDRR